MPRSAPCKNRSCAIVRPEIRSVVCARWPPVRVVGLSSRQCSLPASRPSAAICSISNFFSSASTSMSTLALAPRTGSRLRVSVSVFSMVSTLSPPSGLNARHNFLIVDELLDAHPNQAGILGRHFRRVHRPVGLDPLRIRGDLLFGLGDHLFQRRVLLLARLELLPLELQQLETLLFHAELQLVGPLAGVLEPLLVELERVGVGLDADLDRATRLVGVDVVQRRVGR